MTMGCYAVPSFHRCNSSSEQSGRISTSESVGLDLGISQLAALISIRIFTDDRVMALTSG